MICAVFWSSARDYKNNIVGVLPSCSHHCDRLLSYTGARYSSRTHSIWSISINVTETDVGYSIVSKIKADERGSVQRRFNYNNGQTQWQLRFMMCDLVFAISEGLTNKVLFLSAWDIYTNVRLPLQADNVLENAANPNEEGVYSDSYEGLRC